MPFDKPGKKSLLVVTHVKQGLAAAPTTIDVIPARRDAIPRAGERPPPISTATVASAAGNVKAIDTRLPPDDMHDVDFADVIAKKPVALLFATRALCESTRLRPGRRHRAAGEGRLRRPHRVHPPRGLRRQRPQHGTARAAAGIQPAHRAVAVCLLTSKDA